MIEIADTNQSELKQAPGPSEDTSELFEEIWRNLKLERSRSSQERQEKFTDEDYFAGRQWNEEDLLKLQEEGRPAVCFNRLPRTVNAVSGLEVQNRQEPNCYPVEEGDVAVSEYDTNVLRYYRQSCDAEDEDSRAFYDALKVGRGWTEVYVEFEGMKRNLVVKRVPWKEMIWDPKGTWVARVRDLNRKAFLEDYPGEEFKPYAFWGAQSEGEPHDATNDWRYENDQSDKLGNVKTMSVIHYQYREKVRMYAVASSNGDVIEVDKARFNKLKKEIDAAGMTYTSITKTVYKQCIVTKDKILQQSVLKANLFTFQSITGYHDEVKETEFGLIRLQRDPQMYANKWLSQIMHIVNSGAKNGLIAEQGVFSNPREAEQRWAVPGSITTVTPGSLSQGKIMPKEPPAYPEGIDRLLNYAVGAIQDVVGVSLELLGMADRDQPIGLEESRKKAGITMLANFFDSLRRYRKNNARVLMDYIIAYIPEGTLVRIVGEQGAKYVPLIKSQLSKEYDIIVDDAPTSPNMKERVFNVLAQFLPMALQSGIPVPPDILKFAPLPDSLVQKWMELINSQQNTPEAQQMKQMQMANAQLDIQQKQAGIKKTESEVVSNYAKAEQYHAVGQDESAQAMQKMGMESQMKHEAMLQEQRRKDYEMLMNHQRKEKEAALALQHKQQMHAMDMQQKAMMPMPQQQNDILEQRAMP